MNLIFLFLLTLFIACSIGLCQNSSSQVNTCFTWFFTSVPVEYKHFLCLCFLFCCFSEFPFLLLPIPVFCPVPEFLYNLSSRISPTHNRSGSTFCPFHLLLPLSPHSIPILPSLHPFPPAEFQFWLSLQNKLHFSQGLSQVSCAGVTDLSPVSPASVPHHHGTRR